MRKVSLQVCSLLPLQRLPLPPQRLLLHIILQTGLRADAAEECCGSSLQGLHKVTAHTLLLLLLLLKRLQLKHLLRLLILTTAQGPSTGVRTAAPGWPGTWHTEAASA